MDIAGSVLAFSAVAVLVVVVVVGLFVVRALNRSSKGTGEDSGLLGQVEHGVGSFVGRISSQADTRGGLLDQLDSVGQKLVSTGIVQQATWESSFAPVAAELIKHKPKAPVAPTAAEAPPA